MKASIDSGAQSMLNYFGDKHTWQWQHKVISETPGQRVVAHYLFKPDSTNQNLEAIETVGKFYANADIGQHCYHAMRGINGQLSQYKNAPLAIPEPLFFDQQNQLLVLKWVSSQAFFDLLAKPGFEHYFLLAGKALAYLHNLPALFGETKTLADHITELMTPHPLMLAHKLPKQAERINTILNNLLALETQYGITTPVPLHRDFHLRQLFYEHDKLWLIDWDMYALGDPALDVGNFITYLETKIPTQSNPAIAAFLEGYQTIRPDLCTANIRLYQAFTYLRLACKAYRLKVEESDKRIEQNITKCESLLA